MQPENEPPQEYQPEVYYPAPFPPPHQQYQQPIVTHQTIETNQKGLRGSHAALIIWGSIIALPVIGCILCMIFAAIGAATSSGTTTP